MADGKRLFGTDGIRGPFGEPPLVRETVTAIALRWGFTHLARFSGQYRARFGELPSQTLSTTRLAS